MAIRLGEVAPDFIADTTHGTIRFHEWKAGKWALLFSHPRDFTPVCTTELGAVAGLKEEFDRRGVKAIGLSVDPVESHLEWEKDIGEVTGHEMNFPMIADPDRKLARMYDMIHPAASETVTVRSVFVIDPANVVRLTMTYPSSTGRNFREILRAIDALQLADRQPIATPADWQPGDDVIVALSLSDEEAERVFPAGFEAKKPYLRLVKQPA
jgi:alkyl hydroperoxide reductase subunit AhpC